MTQTDKCHSWKVQTPVARMELSLFFRKWWTIFASEQMSFSCAFRISPKNPTSSSCCHKPPPAATVKQDELICIQNSDNKLPLPFVINQFRRVKIWCKFILVSSYYFWKPCCCFSTNPSPTSASIHLRTQPRWWTKMQQQQRLVTSDPVEDQS